MDPPYIVARDPDCPLHGVEEIRPFPLSPSYSVTESGKVRRIDAAEFLRPCVLKRGDYLAVSLWENGKGRTWPVHQIVALTFLDKRPSPKHEVAHIDGIKTNNHWRNLRWATRQENERDKITHGTSNHGERNGSAKLTNAEVLAIINAPRTRGYQMRLAEQYGVTQSAISNIIRGKRR